MSTGQMAQLKKRGIGRMLKDFAFPQLVLISVFSIHAQPKFRES